MAQDLDVVFLKNRVTQLELKWEALQKLLKTQVGVIELLRKKGIITDEEITSTLEDLLRQTPNNKQSVSGDTGIKTSPNDTGSDKSGLPSPAGNGTVSRGEKPQTASGQIESDGSTHSSTQGTT